MLLSLEATPTFDYGGPGFAPSAVAATASMMAATDPSIADASQPSIVMRDEAGNPWSSFGETTSDGSFDGSVEGDAEVVSDDASAVVIAPGLQELTPEEMVGLATVLWTADHVIEGKLDASQNWVAYKIPIGPKTSFLYLSLDPARADSAVSLRIDQVYLVNSGGDVLAKVAATPTPGQDANGGRRLSVTLLGAPEDSQLVVRVARDDQPPASTGGGVEGGSPSLGGGSSEFVLSVLRNDPAPTAPEDPAAPPAMTMPAWTLGAVSSPMVIAPGASRATQATQLVVDGLIRLGGARSVGVGASASARFETGAEPARAANDAAPSVYLGPLVSRGAAPLGPTLATSTDEPTPLIDRENQVVDEALDHLGADLDSSLLAGLRPRAGSTLEVGIFADGRAVEDAEAPDEATVVMPGPGGLPVLVSRAGRSLPRAEAVALAAHLQSRSVEEALSAEVPAAPPMADQVASEARVARAGLATRAAGLIIGLGLATGPLYPDLIALARRHIARAKRRNATIRRRWPFPGHPARPVV